MPDTRLILHVKGTERETTELPKQVVRAAISQGQLTHSQLIWSPSDQAWKQVREMPHLLPSQKLAPAPAPRVGTTPLPTAKAIAVAVHQPQTGSVPRVAARAATGTPNAQAAVKVSAGGTPKARAAGTPSVRAASQGSEPSAGNLVVKEAHDFHPIKWLCVVLGVLILVALVFNYLFVDRPLVSQLGETSYANVSVYAHLGAFMQPNVLVIHIPSSATVTRANLTDFLVALARSTPQAPFSSNLFDRVALTTGWTGRYSFSGYTWKEMGEMGKDDEAQRKEFLLDQMGDASGQSLMPASTLNEDEQQVGRDQIWETFVSYFTRS